MTSQMWTTKFIEDDLVLGESYMNFGGKNQTTNDTVFESQVEVIDLTGPVLGHQYVNVSGIGPKNDTVIMTAN